MAHLGKLFSLWSGEQCRKQKFEPFERLKIPPKSMMRLKVESFEELLITEFYIHQQISITSKAQKFSC